MPLCGGSSGSAKTEDNKNKAIDKKLKKDKKTFEMTHRIPVVGAGESGKSTLIKQMHIIYINGFSDEERKSKIMNIRFNVRDAILAITGAMHQIDPPVELENPDNKVHVQLIRDIPWDGVNTDPRLFESTTALWNDAGVKTTYCRANEYQLIDSAKYFLDQLDKVGQPDYLPSDQDILRCRMLTSGIYETKFEMNKSWFHMFDVGGQREERRKWIQVFSDVTAVIFVCACSGYDMTLREAKNMNRLRESITLFKDIWCHRYLRQTSMILFLNKQDLLEQKILAGTTNISDFFPEYDSFQLENGTSSSPNTSSSNPTITRVKEFIKFMFMKKANEFKGDSNRICYAHFTTAVDTENIKRVFDDCRDALRRMYMQKLGLI